MIRLTIILLILPILFASDIRISFSDTSVVSYKGSHPAHSWEGISKRVKGGILCKDDSLKDCIMKVIIQLESFDSGNYGRDSNMLFHTESHKYPFVKFNSDSFSIIDSINSHFDLTGILEFHGIENKISSNIQIFNKNNIFSGLTEFRISLDDYNVDKPQLLFVPISDGIEIKCNLFCKNELLNKLLKNEEK